MINVDYRTGSDWDGNTISRRSLYDKLQKEDKAPFEAKTVFERYLAPDWFHPGLYISDLSKAFGTLIFLIGAVSFVVTMPIVRHWIAIAVDGPFIAIGGGMAAIAFAVKRYYLNQRLDEKNVKDELKMISEHHQKIEQFKNRKFSILSLNKS